MFKAGGIINAVASKWESGIFYNIEEIYIAIVKSASQRMRWARKRPDCKGLCRPW